MGLPDFLESLSEADQAAADGFAEALDQAAECFTAQQQEQITAWTGLPISAAKSAQAQEQEEPVQEEVQEQLEEEPDVQDDDGSALEKQLAQLREEANAALASTRVKTEAETHDVFSRKQAGGTGQPRARGQGLRSHRRRRPFLGRKYRRQRAVARKEMAVAGVLLEASFLWMRLHACMAWPHGRTSNLDSSTASRSLGLPNLVGWRRTQISGTQRANHFAKAPYSQWTSRKLMKGTPTLAPMTPAKSEDDFNDI
ncbi:Hypothetical protein SCF082_LOCUS27736 [Durusdinium trenchii]|uniref:Uncharacterized protein n=1 Tax=Durusdinium trenchii TaxID=1381693 RepID=A0ABP0MFE8_9DINO